MDTYIIRAGLQEESNDGWVYMARRSRTVVRITHPEAGGNVICQVRDLRDDNFVRYYNKPGEIRRPLERHLLEQTMVMSKWYRDCLGIAGTTEPDNVRGRADLVVTELSSWGFGPLRATSHHPDVVVRLATRLGLLGAWLGLFGLITPVMDAFFVHEERRIAWTTLIVALLFGALAIWLSLGPRRPHSYGS